ncbi:MAG: hypothetical protein DRI39_01085 [Chloroflexi bacterium]|nr:MAG: hypothetical protein DRI39_01085 [Chloroflexota bacterium]
MIKSRREEPRRKVSRWERERRRRRIVQAIIVIVIFCAATVVGYGVYDTHVRPWRQPIVRVNDTVFDMEDFVKVLRLYGATGENYQQDWQLADSVVESLKNNGLVKQAALRFGLFANATEIEEKTKSFLGFNSEEETEEEFQERFDDLLQRLDMSRADFERLLVEPAVLQTKVREYIGEENYPTGASFEHVNVKAILLGTEDEALDVRGRWDTEGFDQLVNASSSSHYYPKDDEDAWLPQGIEKSAVFNEYAFGEGSEDLGVVSQPLRDTEYSTKGGYWLVMVVDERQTEAEEGEEAETELQLKGILLDSSSEANELKGRIEGGEDFGELAAEHSLHSASKDQGGDLGWLTSESIESRFGEDNLDTILALDHNVVSEPLFAETTKKSGYWLIEVLDTKQDTLSEGHRTRLVSQAYTDWLAEQKQSDENVVEDYLNDDKRRWALDHVAV